MHRRIRVKTHKHTQQGTQTATRNRSGSRGLATSHRRISHLTALCTRSIYVRVRVLLCSLLSLPFAFSQSGWMVGALCMVGVGLFSLSTMRAMIDAVHLTRQRLRRRKKASVAHGIARSMSRKSIAALAQAAERGERGTGEEAKRNTHGSPSSSLAINGASYGSTLDAPSPVGSPGGSPPGPSVSDPGPDALDPLDLSIIKADPDADVIGYQQVAYVCYGEYGRVFTDSVVIFCQMGSCSAFLILVLGNIEAVLASYGMPGVPLEPIALVLLPIIIALALPRSTTFLASAAHFGNATMAIALATIVCFGLTSRESALGRAVHQEGEQGIWDVISQLDAWSGSLQGISVFFGISAFSFAAHCEVVAVEADAVDRKTYQRVLSLTMTVITSLYIFLGVFAFACFDLDTKPNIMLNLGSGFFVNLVRITVSCTLLVNISMALLPASQTLDLIIIGAAPLSVDIHHQVEANDGDNASSSRASSGHWPVAVVAITPAEELMGQTPQRTPEQMAKEEEFARYHRKGNYIRIASVIAFMSFGSVCHSHSLFSFLWGVLLDHSLIRLCVCACVCCLFVCLRCL